MKATQEIRRVCGFKIGQEVIHQGKVDWQPCTINAFPNRRSAVVHYTGDRRTWNSALVPVKELKRA